MNKQMFDIVTPYQTIHVGINQNQFDELHRKIGEQQFNIKLLELWQHVDFHLGMVIRTQVKAFTFRDAFMTKDEKLFDPPYSGHTHHNAVRLYNDNVIPMPMIARPEPPEHMKVTIEEK